MNVFCSGFSMDFITRAGKLIVRGVAVTMVPVLSRKTTSCVFDSLQRRSSGRVRRLSANMELGSELEAHNPLESFHQL